MLMVVTTTAEVITPEELQKMRAQIADLCILDVRTPSEYVQLGHLPTAKLLPIQVLDQFVDTLNPVVPTVVVCEHGVRSTHACLFLAERGFSKLYNLGVGMAGWDGERSYDAPVSLA
jgi:rhodanese-related sulfurtransferase